MNLTLWPFQQKAVHDIRSAYKSGFRAPLLVLPTGSGKTVIFCYITEKTAAKGNSVTILVHRQELLNQTSEHLSRIGVPHGLVAPGHSMTGDPIQIASVQTLVRRLDLIRDQPTLLVIDEAHHAVAGSWRKIIEAWPKTRLLGVTATPMRLDGKGLGKHAGGYFDTLVGGPQIHELITDGYLSVPITYGPPVGANLAKIKIQAGDYQAKELEFRLDKPHITGCAIEHYQRICPGMPAIAFCATIAHAEHVAEQFNLSGISAASIDGTLASSIRKYRIQSLASGQIKVLTSCDIVSEGTDIPVVTAAILLRKTKSLSRYLQWVGRALRIHPDKKNSFILDHADNWSQPGFGLADDHREWSLDGCKKTNRPREVQLIRCPKCFRMCSANTRVCPDCGTVLNVKSGDNKRTIQQVDGRLEKIEHKDFDFEKYKQRHEQGMAQSIEELREIGRRRGYHYKWAERVWEARQKKQMVAV